MRRGGAALLAAALLVAAASTAEAGDLGGLRPPGWAPPSVFEAAWSEGAGADGRPPGAAPTAASWPGNWDRATLIVTSYRLLRDAGRATARAGRGGRHSSCAASARPRARARRSLRTPCPTTTHPTSSPTPPTHTVDGAPHAAGRGRRLRERAGNITDAWIKREQQGASRGSGGAPPASSAQRRRRGDAGLRTSKAAAPIQAVTPSHPTHPPTPDPLARTAPTFPTIIPGQFIAVLREDAHNTSAFLDK